MQKYLYSDDQVLAMFKEYVAEDKRHTLYESDCSIADFWYKIVTGEGQEEILLKYRIGESPVQKDQRARITNTKTRYVTNKIRTTLKEVDRCDSVRDIIQYGSNSEEKSNAISEILDCISD